MKKFALALALAIIAKVAFTQATPIQYDETTQVSENFDNPCTGEMVTLNYPSIISVCGVNNNNRLNFNLHILEVYDGVGQTSGAI